MSNQPIFEDVGIELRFWDLCTTGSMRDAVACPLGWGPTLALPDVPVSAVRMQLTAVCSPFMAVLVGVFFTYSPKNMLMWKGVFRKVFGKLFKGRANVVVAAKTETTGASNQQTSTNTKCPGM